MAGSHAQPLKPMAGGNPQHHPSAVSASSPPSGSVHLSSDPPSDSVRLKRPWSLLSSPSSPSSLHGRQLYSHFHQGALLRGGSAPEDMALEDPPSLPLHLQSPGTDCWQRQLSGQGDMLSPHAVSNRLSPHAATDSMRWCPTLPEGSLPSLLRSSSSLSKEGMCSDSPRSHEVTSPGSPWPSRRGPSPRVLGRYSGLLQYKAAPTASPVHVPTLPVAPVASPESMWFGREIHRRGTWEDVSAEQCSMDVEEDEVDMGDVKEHLSQDALSSPVFVSKRSQVLGSRQGTPRKRLP